MPGLPGERLGINNGRIFVNNHPIDRLGNMVYGQASNFNFGPIDIPQAHYFLIGDNMGNSMDSRDDGPVPKSNIFYKALLVYRPFRRFQILV